MGVVLGLRVENKNKNIQDCPTELEQRPKVCMMDGGSTVRTC